jgi:hypothetical protein
VVRWARTVGLDDRDAAQLKIHKITGRHLADIAKDPRPEIVNFFNINCGISASGARDLANELNVLFPNARPGS